MMVTRGREQGSSLQGDTLRHQPAAGGGGFHPKSPWDPCKGSTVIPLWVEGSKMSRYTRGTTTYYCRAQTPLAGRDCVPQPGVKRVTLLFFALWMRAPKCPSLFRVSFCSFLVRPHLVLDTTKQTLTPDRTFQLCVVMSLSSRRWNIPHLCLPAPSTT